MMKFIDIIKRKQLNWRGARQPSIAFLGDSVTHGCFGVYEKNSQLHTIVQMDKSYHQNVKTILGILYPEVPVTIVNAGISGDCAVAGKERLDRDVLSYKPDLVIICYGLNDSMQEEKGIEAFRQSLDGILSEITESGAEAIFMTPNLRTEKYDRPAESQLIENVTNSVIKNGVSGWLEKYMEAAKEVCSRNNVPVCDCNTIWKKMKQGGVDINNLLSNRINHPTEQLHWLFAYELVRMMLLEGER